MTRALRTTTIVAPIIALVIAGACRGPSYPAVEPPRDRALELEIAVVEQPRDPAAKLALAAELETTEPSRALALLEAVVRLGGPLGTRWSDADRARYARLLAARGRAQLARGSLIARVTLDRAHAAGAQIDTAELDRAAIAAAIATLRHADAATRARGRAVLAARATPGSPWLGAAEHASPELRGRFGAWAWQVGARREAYDDLAAWHATGARDAELDDAYARARAWWAVDPSREEVTHAASASIARPALVDDLAADTTPPIDLGALAAARYAARAMPAGASVRALAELASAYVRDPALAVHRVRNYIDGDIDDIASEARIAALYDALGDPARARTHWQRCADAEPSAELELALALAIARTGDAPAAVVTATAAAAASGDPAAIWLALGHAFARVGRPVEAMAAARAAVELAGADRAADALDLAIATSRALGRSAQASALADRRGALQVPIDEPARSLVAYERMPTAGTLAALYVAVRAAPDAIDERIALVRTLDREDPRWLAIARELADLADAADRERGLAAVEAIRAP